MKLALNVRWLPQASESGAREGLRHVQGGVGPGSPGLGAVREWLCCHAGARLSAVERAGADDAGAGNQVAEAMARNLTMPGAFRASLRV